MPSTQLMQYVKVIFPVNVQQNTQEIKNMRYTNYCSAKYSKEFKNANDTKLQTREGNFNKCMFEMGGLKSSALYLQKGVSSWCNG